EKTILIMIVQKNHIAQRLWILIIRPQHFVKPISAIFLIGQCILNGIIQLKIRHTFQKGIYGLTNMLPTQEISLIGYGMYPRFDEKREIAIYSQYCFCTLGHKSQIVKRISGDPKTDHASEFVPL